MDDESVDDDRDELRSGWGGESRQEWWGWRNESGSCNNKTRTTLILLLIPQLLRELHWLSHFGSAFNIVCALLTQPCCWFTTHEFNTRWSCLPSGFGTCIKQPTVVCQECTIASWRLNFFWLSFDNDLAIALILHSITVVCLQLLTVVASVPFVFCFRLILYSAPAMSLTWQCHFNQYIVIYLLTYLLTVLLLLTTSIDYRVQLTRLTLL